MATLVRLKVTEAKVFLGISVLKICRRTPTPKCVFNKVALQLCWNRISTWVFTCKFGAYFHNNIPFPKNTASGRLLLRWVKKEGYTFLSPARIKNKRDKWIWRKTIHRKWNNISYCWMFQHFLILVVEHRQAIVQNWAEQCPRFRNNGTKLIMAGEGK